MYAHQHYRSPLRLSSASSDDRLFRWCPLHRSRLKCQNANSLLYKIPEPFQNSVLLFADGRKRCLRAKAMVAAPQNANATLTGHSSSSADLHAGEGANFSHRQGTSTLCLGLVRDGICYRSARRIGTPDKHCPGNSLTSPAIPVNESSNVV